PGPAGPGPGRAALPGRRGAGARPQGDARADAGPGEPVGRRLEAERAAIAGPKGRGRNRPMTTGTPTNGAPAPDAHRPRVLLVDDHREVRSAVSKYLGYNG